MLTNLRFETGFVKFLLLFTGIILSGLGVLLLLVQMFSGTSFLPQGLTLPAWIESSRLALELLLRGGLVLTSWLVLQKRDCAVLLAQKKYFVLVIAIAISTVLWVIIIFNGSTAVIGGVRYWWLGDDAMISMRYAHNMANGIGLVWNPGERVEGYTNFLWTLYMTLIHLLPLATSKTSLVILLTNFALFVGTIPVIINLIRILGGDTIIVGAVLAGFIQDKSTLVWAAQGFETTLLAFLLLFAVYRIVKESQLNQPNLFTYFLIALISLVRADAMVISALLYLFTILVNRNTKTVVLYLAISLTLPIAHLIFRVYYYGDILPNTAYLKTTNWNGRYSAGLRYVLSFLSYYAFPFILATAGAFVTKNWSKRLLWGMLILFTGYIGYVGGDAFIHFRFFVPIIPLLMILAFLSIRNFIRQEAPRVGLSLLCLISMPLIIPGYTPPGGFPIFSPDPIAVGLVQTGLLFKQNTPPTSRVAAFQAGSIFYYSERYGIDLLGKSDRYIAHLPVTIEKARVGHNKFDFSHSLGELKPDDVVSSFQLPVDEEQMKWMAEGDWAFVGQLYFDPLFHEHCLANPVNIKTVYTIFVCDWSSQLGKQAMWQDLPDSSAVD